MTPIPTRAAAPLLATLLLLGDVALDSAPAAAQGSVRRRSSESSTPVAQASATRAPRVRSEAMARGRYVVVVDLDANRLYFARGRRVLWSAVVGTGTGLRLETEQDAWDFSTPNGAFHVQYKEKDPVWLAPDWYFVENGLPVPPKDGAARRFPGGLGSAAVYIGHGLAIHGTDKPELLGQRVSHGCIRLSNRDALRLFHEVQPGTEVVIVGGQDQSAVPPPAARRRQTGSSRPPQRDPFLVQMEGLSTFSLLDRLDDELFVATATPGEVRWPTVASALLSRGVREEDDDALEGLLARGATLAPGRLREEFSTVVADVYAQGTIRTLEALGRMDRAARLRVASEIVEATLALYPGDSAGPVTPWPTRRAAREALSRTAQRGWDALQAAERAHRERNGIGGARPAELR
jgi:lipoprotein-anchoring transpeptidase ErfK/SrfK